MPKDDLESRLIDAVTGHGLFTTDAVVVVGVSGGADSIALLNLLHEVNQQAGWSLRLHVAHLNHQLRGEHANQDAAFVENTARRLRLDRTIESADIRELAEQQGTSVEEAGRRRRFEFFERVCLRVGARTVALAHQADDNAETVLHRIIRGTGLRGLAGIRWKRPISAGGEIMVVRPLLAVRRQEIETWLAARGLDYCRDASNQAPIYTRNRIRLDLLPLLRERFNPQVSDALLRLADQAGGVDAYLSETGERMLESVIVEHNSGQLVLHCATLARKPRVVQTHILRQAILRMGVGERDLTYGHLNAVAEMTGGESGTKSMDLPGGLKVVRRYSRLILTRPGAVAAKSQRQVRVPFPGTATLTDQGLEISTEIIHAEPAEIDAHIRARIGQSQPCCEEWLDADRVHPPLIARLRQPGDRFFPLGSTGMKKISDFFIDAKIDPQLREKTLILCDQLGPIWVVPFRMDERVRLTRMTRRVLRVVARPVGPA